MVVLSLTKNETRYFYYTTNLHKLQNYFSTISGNVGDSTFTFLSPLSKTRAPPPPIVSSCSFQSQWTPRRLNLLSRLHPWVKPLTGPSLHSIPLQVASHVDRSICRHEQSVRYTLPWMISVLFCWIAVPFVCNFDSTMLWGIRCNCVWVQWCGDSSRLCYWWWWHVDWKKPLSWRGPIWSL